VIRVEGVVFDYPGKRALHGVSVEVPAGAVLALVGPNGAGKSTLMRVIAGLDEPVAGSVFVDGVNVLDAPRLAHRRLGYLSDFFGLYEELTVRQCLLHAASIRGVAAVAQDAAVASTARRMGIADRLEHTAASLSRGLRQRLAIGQAIVHQPAVLLLDEPAAGLDPEARSSLSALFRSLRAQGMTLMVSSHILAELEEYSTHMLAIRDGRIAAFTELLAPVTAGVQRLRIALAAPWTAPAGFWQSVGAGLREAPANSAAHADTLWVDMPNGAAGAARLLKALVGAQAAVCECTVHRETLQDSYLRTATAIREASNAQP
jgi:ABC-2 type transport system ATP-binding protein